jgi:flagellar biogenesis protein FliO
MTMTYWQIVGALLGVLGLLLLFLATIKYMMQKNSGSQTSALKVIARLPLDTKNSLTVVSYNNKEHLILLSPQGGSLLSITDLKKEEAP